MLRSLGRAIYMDDAIQIIVLQISQNLVNHL